jgi:hypothetical protein
LGLAKGLEAAREAREVAGAEVFVLEGGEHLLKRMRKKSSVFAPNAGCRSFINRGFSVLN